MCNLLDSKFAYTPSNKTDVQARWKKHGWVPPTQKTIEPMMTCKFIDALVHEMLKRHFWKTKKMHACITCTTATCTDINMTAPSTEIVPTDAQLRNEHARLKVTVPYDVAMNRPSMAAVIKAAAKARIKKRLKILERIDYRKLAANDE